MSRHCFIITLFVAFSFYAGFAQDARIVFYNVENLFDCEDDPKVNDNEFLPRSMRRWTITKYHEKLNRTAKVILNAGDGVAPVIVGLCEVENQNVLEDLVKNPALAKFNYGIIHLESPDPRGIDVALLYRPDFFKPFYYKAIPLKSSDPGFRTRDILQVSGVLDCQDTLTVFVNHWPSRYGGPMETKALRVLAAQTLKKACVQILGDHARAKIVCMGDFNDEPNDESLSETLNAKAPAKANSPTDLVNLSAAWGKLPLQTHKNLGQWETFDQFIVSDNLIKSTEGYKADSAFIFHAAFLLEPDTQYTGQKPFRTWSGFKYLGGFSDHLPIVLKLKN